ncbi:MAG: DUF1538 domain-containing protein [Mobiluncus porci]|uniref:DUF1538 domain-containing protein n=1 Tax=Mobiluncus TaxID=2050 RepID=UPI0023F05023|nr:MULTISPECIES: DUF1538 domain-containing protein [Mobiluncus]MCI6585150.1 DUF1538 domain-containing protein [Mobiluncus sp.]MDD7541750.1 DUF1538 domain-containing protein [Mobiluncus porci]MDY5747998.1 DUF1538 domain-containing protein [Mobiluncus porci]
MNALTAKLKETTFSVVPIAAVVVILHLTLVPLEGTLLPRFVLGAVIVILGLSLFLLGVDIGIAPIGRIMASEVVKSGRFAVVMAVTFILGFLLTMAEPDILIYAGQVNTLTRGIVSSTLMILVVSLGLAVMLCLGMVRILRGWRLRWVLLASYGLVLLLALVAPKEYLGIAFDASGATTGPLTVPVVLALATGVAAMKRDSTRSEADAFGLVAIACVGAILALQITTLALHLGALPNTTATRSPDTTHVISPLLHHVPLEARSVFFALLPLLVLFLIGNFASFKLNRRHRRSILSGIVMTFLGLTLFLTGANGGFMDVGREIGLTLTERHTPLVLLAVAFILGLMAVLAEPAVHVLTEQVQDVTSGSVRRAAVMGAMALGVGLAVFLSTLRLVVNGLELWHLLLPGYLVAVGLTFASSELFGGLAFDGGGVAPGPMVTTFVLAFAQGAAAGTPGADPVVDGLGLISMVALLPPVAIQLLGVLFQARSRIRTNLKRKHTDPWDDGGVLHRPKSGTKKYDPIVSPQGLQQEKEN